TFALNAGGPAWLSMDAKGNLSGTPTNNNLGANNYTVTVTNTSGLSATASLVITVNAAPMWTVNPITFTTTANNPFAASIANDATEPQNHELTFSLNAGGPAWLSMDAKGNLSGMPTNNNLGANKYTVTVTNTSGLSATASL